MDQKVIGKTISILHRKHRALINAKLNEKGIRLGSSQLQLLMPLFVQDGIHQHKLCELYHIDKAAVARGIRKLELQGLISKETDPVDNRKVKLHLTPAAVSLKQPLSSILEHIDSSLKVHLKEEEISRLFLMLDKIEKAIDSEMIIFSDSRTDSSATPGLTMRKNISIKDRQTFSGMEPSSAEQKGRTS